MFALAELQALQHQSSALRQKRQGESELYFEQGMLALTQAHQAGFQDPVPAQQALKAFVEAIRQQRSDPRPYLMLAYIFAVFEDFRSAASYLRAAHELAPNDPDVANFRQRIQALQLKRSLISEDDRTYQALEQQLRSRIQALSKQPLAAPSADQAVVAEQLRQVMAFDSLLQELTEQVQALRQDLDTGELEKLLMRLNQVWQPHARVCQDSQLLCRLKNQMLETQAGIPVLWRRIQSTPAAADLQLLESDLEALLDQCDRYADQLDALEQRQISIQSVEAVYAQLLAHTEAVQDSLDERLADLSESILQRSS